MTQAPGQDTHTDDYFRKIAETVPVIIWMSGSDGGCTFVNNYWCSYTGRSFEESLGAGWAESIHPDDTERCVRIYREHAEKQQPYQIEYRIRRHDGEYHWVLDKAVPKQDENGAFAGYIGSCMDIHESRTMSDVLEEKVASRTAAIVSQSEKIREQQEFSDTIFNASVDVIVVYGKNYEFLAVNQAARKMYGFPDDIVGKKLPEVFSNIEESQGFSDLKRALKGEMIHNAVYRSAAIPGLFFEDYLIPLKKNDEIYAVLVIARDITGRIQSEHELKQLNERLTSQNLELQSSNEDLESFNYIASHDLQEPLRKVNMFAGRILERDGDRLSEASKDYFERLTSAINRMQNLIQSLLAYSSTSSEQIRFVKTNLNKMVKEIKAGLEEVVTDKKAVIESDELPSISVAPVQFQQLLHNLISNALKYSKPDVAPVVRISAETVTVPERNDREFWKISVRDNGIGFDPAYKHKIFELFQRLHGKTEYEGTGIGLAICRKIAGLHNGFITADSEKGKGAVFEVFIPVKNKS